ncbi:hypothetical protein [Streptomyces alanosinicus]|uniref:Uncharacterized protein n=1 Tax=Streptomyces alanosinicus TaxID=68171 RepID=A0A918YLS1_9ACTN|nr:hypothetical protein [Streptomyces alanosinicus]GHE08567.1 hypothetical protein GCM10010339_57820 [Streptomyces alanosinicus]
MTGFRPGGMGDKGGTDTPAAFAGSLAATIEHKLHDLVRTETGKEPFALDDNSPDARARRALFVAISQAVVEHLHDHASDGLLAWDSAHHPCTVNIRVDAS